MRKPTYDAFDTLLTQFVTDAVRVNLSDDMFDSPVYGQIRECVDKLAAARGAVVNPQPACNEVSHPIVRPEYSGLYSVLCQALSQAQDGKGAERHNIGGDVPFERQRMQQISDLIESVDGMTYQACKKITEGVSLPTLERQERELLGAINYIAGMIIWLRKQPTKDDS